MLATLLYHIPSARDCCSSFHYCIPKLQGYVSSPSVYMRYPPLFGRIAVLCDCGFLPGFRCHSAFYDVIRVAMGPGGKFLIFCNPTFHCTNLGCRKYQVHISHTLACFHLGQNHVPSFKWFLLFRHNRPRTMNITISVHIVGMQV
jgi:hypothetical protein